jgi:hypothetical protein
MSLPTLFGVVAASGLVGGVVMAALSKPIQRLMSGVN